LGVIAAVRVVTTDAAGASACGDVVAVVVDTADFGLKTNFFAAKPAPPRTMITILIMMPRVFSDMPFFSVVSDTVDVALSGLRLKDQRMTETLPRSGWIT
jgi:hypothetical protein